MKWPNKPAAGKAGIASPLTIELYRLYPERIWVDRVLAFADDESLYEASELISVQP